MSWIEGEKTGHVNAPYTDEQLVFELARRLGLKEGELESLKSDEYCVLKRDGEHGVCFSNGNGYNNFHVEFYFDENGKLEGHGVWE
jgi:hypothetical protein